MNRHHNKWLQEEDDHLSAFLNTSLSKKEIETLAESMGRTVNAIDSRMSLLRSRKEVPSFETTDTEDRIIYVSVDNIDIQIKIKNK